MGTAYTARRTNPTGEGRFIRAYAKAMLRQSKHRHGPYRTKLTVRRVPAGNQTTVTVRVQNQQGLGPVITRQQRGIAVDVTYAHARTRTVYLNNEGVGRVYFRAAAGKTLITAAAHTVPDAALLLRRPNNTAASQVAVADHHRTLRLRGYGLGVTTQSLTITNASAFVLVGHPLQGTYSVTGLSGAETVDYAVYGPFTSSATSCTGTAPLTARSHHQQQRHQLAAAMEPREDGLLRLARSRARELHHPAGECLRHRLPDPDQHRHQTIPGRCRIMVKVGHPSARTSSCPASTGQRRTPPPRGSTVPSCTRTRPDVPATTSSASCPPPSRTNKQWRKTTVVGSDSNTGYYVFQTTLDAGTFMRSSQSGCGTTIQVAK